MSERSEKIELSDLELSLRELRPQSEALDRAALMYRAGRASARGWMWPLATMATTTLAAVLGVLLLLRPAPPVVEQIVYVPAPAARPDPPSPKSEENEPPPPPQPPVQKALDSSPRGRYLRMQERILLWGLEGVPPPSPTPPLEKMPTTEQLLHSL